MIDRKHASNEIGRLIGTDYFPSEVKAQKELITALTYALTEPIATAVINEWLLTMRTRPTPADLRGMVAQQNEKYRTDKQAAEDSAPKVYGCYHCHDHGLYGGQIGTGQFDGPWKWCDCSAGRERRARELEEIEMGRGMDSMRRSPRVLDSVAEANQAREKLIRKFGPKTIKRMVSDPEAYHGEF